MQKPIPPNKDTFIEIELGSVSYDSIDTILESVERALGREPAKSDLKNFFIETRTGYYSDTGSPCLIWNRKRTEQEYEEEMEKYRAELDKYLLHIKENSKELIENIDRQIEQLQERKLCLIKSQI